MNLAGNEISASVVAEEDERGDPRLDLSQQTCMRSRAAVSLAVPITRAADTDNQSIGTKPLAVHGERRAYHAGGEARSQTRYHYEFSRYGERLRPNQKIAAREKLLPIEDDYDYERAWQDYRNSLAKKK